MPLSFRQNCQGSIVATARVLADLLNQAFSVHLCVYGHRNSATFHNPLPSSNMVFTISTLIAGSLSTGGQ